LLSTFKTSFVKIRSKEIIGRTTGRKCCNRHLQKVQGLFCLKVDMKKSKLLNSEDASTI
jgi:hypothetical protein